MKKINILSAGLISPNSWGFLFPIFLNKNKLREYKIQINIYNKVTHKLFDCNFLIIESNFFSDYWESNKENVLEQFIKFKKKVDKVLYFSIGDSSTFDHALMLPYVDFYFKNQLLCDKKLYLKSFYGNRYYTNYYYEKYKLEDPVPSFSRPIDNIKDLNKFKLGWNSGLANWSMLSPYKMKFFKVINPTFLMKKIGPFVEPSKKRPINLSVRFNTEYKYQTISYQRNRIKDIVGNKFNTNKINRFRYFNELKNSKIVVSPFGLGEITLKDFEVFITGGILLKPDMSYMETWPNFFIKNKTYVSHNLDLSDFKSTLEYCLDNYSKIISIAENAQIMYKKYNSFDKKNYLFCEYFYNLMNFDI